MRETTDIVMGGGGGSIGGAIVPSVKSGLPAPSSELPAPAPIPPPPVYQLHPPQVPASDRAVVEAEVREDDREAEETDKDLLCPICMQIIKDAFLTSCGHSFCYLCIVTHLQNKSDCPSCASYLTTNQIFPNFLLNKVILFIFLKILS